MPTTIHVFIYKSEAGELEFGAALYENGKKTNPTETRRDGLTYSGCARRRGDHYRGYEHASLLYNLQLTNGAIIGMP